MRHSSVVCRITTSRDFFKFFWQSCPQDGTSSATVPLVLANVPIRDKRHRQLNFVAREGPVITSRRELENRVHGQQRPFLCWTCRFPQSWERQRAAQEDSDDRVCRTRGTAICQSVAGIGVCHFAAPFRSRVRGGASRGTPSISAAKDSTACSTRRSAPAIQWNAL